MKTRIIYAFIIAFSLSSWVNNPEKVQVQVRLQVKEKSNIQKSSPVKGQKKQSVKQSSRLLFESVLHHLI